MRKHLRSRIGSITNPAISTSASPSMNTFVRKPPSTKPQRFLAAYALAVKTLEDEVLASPKPQRQKRFSKIDFGLEMVNPSVGIIENEIIMGKFFPPDGVLPARMVIYRAPIEERFSSGEALYLGILNVIRTPVLKFLKITKQNT